MFLMNYLLFPSSSSDSGKQTIPQAYSLGYLNRLMVNNRQVPMPIPPMYIYVDDGAEMSILFENHIFVHIIWRRRLCRNKIYHSVLISYERIMSNQFTNAAGDHIYHRHLFRSQR